ncbi:MAG: transketolase [Anaerolineae bacterium]|jgi:transketolase|nr:transketolase [Anaerolineae bacterium]MBT7192186.1 transketolase [Anaerolineae bacterium]MBT7990662.1 transketolase [Anaerolineae bacterium]
MTNENWIEESKSVAAGIRRRVLEHTVRNNGGYLSQACSSAEIWASLYTKILNIGESEAPMIPAPFPGVPSAENKDYFTGVAYNGPKAPDFDRFFLSPVQYALVLYATLVEVGRMSQEGLEQFNTDGSTVEMIGAEHSPGHEITAGSLGQALSQVAGIAYARRKKGDTGRNWLFMSDGEFQIGQTWEALAIAKFHKLDNLAIVVDVNGQQADGAMKDVLDIEPLTSRIEAFGAHVVKVDGNDIKALVEAASIQPEGNPLVILAYTSPYCGIDLLKPRFPVLHYVRFTSEEERAQYAALLEEWNK